MNCIAHTAIDRQSKRFAASAMRRPHKIAWVAMLLVVSACAAAQTEPVPAKVYDVMYTVKPYPRRGTVAVEMRVEQVRRFLREVTMKMPEARFSDVSGDGEISRDGDALSWRPAVTGGVLRWTVKVANVRYGDKYDAWLGKDWGLFRASDIIPPADTRTVVGAHSQTSLQFDLPDKWSAVTQYNDRRGIYSIKNTGRRFDRPAGWMLLGKIGVRIETISGVRVVVAGPLGQAVRRLDMLALMHWTLPEVTKVLPDFPKRIAIVSAAASMWRGGLSGPQSLYLHADLPLISENATSTLLHEIMHIGSGLRAANGADWIVEGLAEYYSLELLRRSRTISNERFKDALADLAEWGKEADALCADASTAAATARAVGVFAALDRELQQRTMNSDALDELVRALVANGDIVSVSDLRRLATAQAG
ncbi:MAG: hypothetical protein WBN32_11515, partial [Woeseia sp.]